MLSTAALLLTAYLIGSIPFGLLLTWLAGHGDIRTIGSGNMGATNVFRTGNKSLAVITILFDGGKGSVAIMLASFLTASPDWLPYGVGLATLIGHMFPVWLKFKGGKGVATAAGILLALSWPVGLAACGTWVVVLVATRYSSLAALTALAVAPIAGFLDDPQRMGPFVLVISLMILARHRTNIRRLRDGTEPKIGTPGK